MWWQLIESSLMNAPQRPMEFLSLLQLLAQDIVDLSWTSIVSNFHTNSYNVRADSFRIPKFGSSKVYL